MCSTTISCKYRDKQETEIYHNTCTPIPGKQLSFGRRFPDELHFRISGNLSTCHNLVVRTWWYYHISLSFAYFSLKARYSNIFNQASFPIDVFHSDWNRSKLTNRLHGRRKSLSRPEISIAMSAGTGWIVVRGVPYRLATHRPLPMEKWWPLTRARSPENIFNFGWKLPVFGEIDVGDLGLQC